MRDSLLTLRRSRLLSALLLVLASIGLGMLSLHFAAVFRADEMFGSYFENGWIAALNIIPCVWLTLLLWFAVRRAGLAFALSSLIVMGFTITSWLKLQFRNDPLLFEDILLVKEAGNMAEQYQLLITKSMVAAAVLLISVVILLTFAAHGRPGGKTRLIGIAVLLVLLIPARAVYTSEEVYTDKTANHDLINRWSSTQLYVSKGFVYPFLYSARTALDTAPAGYHAPEAEEVLAQYQDADIPPEQKVDVLSVMLEAYADFSVYDQIAWKADPYAAYHKLEAEGVSGNLLTNIFAGGTIDSERCFLTGYANMGSFRTPTNSYVRYFADQGYTVTGSHPSYDWFYNRLNINQNLGFESYRFLENHYGALTNGEIAMDSVLFPELVRLHEAEKSDKPYFSFGVTYQGHGPYTRDQNDYETTYIQPGVYTAETEYILNNYFGSIAETSAQLDAFFDHYRASDRPVVIVLFGDHKPWLGDGGSVYAELGIDLNHTDPDAGFRNYYGTRYLIWANDAAKQTLGRDFTGEGRDIGPYFLMDELFRLCGWQGPAYMQATRAVSQAVPVINTSGLYMQDGVVTDKLSAQNEELVRQFRHLEYHQRRNFKQK